MLQDEKKINPNKAITALLLDRFATYPLPSLVRHKLFLQKISKARVGFCFTSPFNDAKAIVLT